MEPIDSAKWGMPVQQSMPSFHQTLNSSYNWAIGKKQKADKEFLYT
jgi:hypothetical protein